MLIHVEPQPVRQEITPWEYIHLEPQPHLIHDRSYSFGKVGLLISLSLTFITKTVTTDDVKGKSTEDLRHIKILLSRFDKALNEFICMSGKRLHHNVHGFRFKARIKKLPVTAPPISLDYNQTSLHKIEPLVPAQHVQKISNQVICLCNGLLFHQLLRSIFREFINRSSQYPTCVFGAWKDDK